MKASLRDPVVVTEGLTKRYGEFTAVDGISLAIPQGVIFGFLGPNGSGKTTTIRMLLGLLPPTAGRAWVLGHDIVAEPLAIRRRIGYMSQRFSLYGDLTVEENLNFFGQAYGVWGERLRQRKDFILEMADLRGRERELARNLAGGWKQRLALGCAIVHRPQVVFLDEPTAGVDPISRREFWGLIYAMAKKGVTVLVTTHYMDEAELCQRVGFLSEGKLIALDTPDQLKRTQMRGHVLEIDCLSSEKAVRILRQARESGRIPFDEIALYGAQIHTVVPDANTYKEPVWELLTQEGIDVHSVEWIAPTLEDVFISSVQARGE